MGGFEPEKEANDSYAESRLEPGEMAFKSLRE
jgi:hypothetical protein